MRVYDVAPPDSDQTELIRPPLNASVAVEIYLLGGMLRRNGAFSGWVRDYVFQKTFYYGNFLSTF